MRRSAPTEISATWEKRESAAASNPDNHDGLNLLGRVAFERGALETAIVHYRRALAVKPDLADACNNMGNALKELGHLADARAAFLKALAHYLQRLGGQRRLVQKCFGATHLIQPIGTVLSRNGKVLTAHTRRWFPVHGIGPSGVAPARGVLLLVQAKTPITNAECQAYFDQHPRVGL